MNEIFDYSASLHEKKYTSHSDLLTCWIKPHCISTEEKNLTIFIILLVGEIVLNPDGSITLPTENITISGDQSDLILTINITLPNDTVSVENVMVFAYTDDDIGGRLISRPVNTSGTTQASPESQMVRRFKLETANVTLTSQLTKNSTTNRFKVRAMFKIALSCSTLYRQSYVIRKIVFVVTSRGKDDRQNEQQYLILYSKSGEIKFSSVVFLV